MNFLKFFDFAVADGPRAKISRGRNNIFTTCPGLLSA